MNIVIQSETKFNLGETVEFQNNTIIKSVSSEKTVGVIIPKFNTPLTSYSYVCPYDFIKNIYKLDNFGVMMKDADGKFIVNENYDPNFNWKTDDSYYLICVNGFAPVKKNEIINNNWSKILEYEFTDLFFIK